MDRDALLLSVPHFEQIVLVRPMEDTIEEVAVDDEEQIRVYRMIGEGE